MSEPRIAIIGCGRHSTANIFPSLRFTPFHLVATCDLDEERAQRNARRFGASRAYTDYREMFEKERLDGVIIVINAALQHAIGLDAMRAGLHVLVEKPPATSSDEVLEAIRVSRETGKTMMTAFKKRYAPAYVKCREIIEARGGTEGMQLNMSYLLGGYGSDEAGARFFLLDAAIHVIDLVTYLFEDIEEVYTLKAPDRASYSVTFRCRSGGIGSLTLSSEGSPRRPSERLELIGDRTLTIVENVINLWHYTSDERHIEIAPTFVTSGNWTEVTTGFAGELRAFADLIVEGRRPPSEIHTAYKTMLLYEAIRDVHGETVSLATAAPE